MIFELMEYMNKHTKRSKIKWDESSVNFGKGKALIKEEVTTYNRMV